VQAAEPCQALPRVSRDRPYGRLPAEQYMPADGILERLRSGALGTAVGELP